MSETTEQPNPMPLPRWFEGGDYADPGRRLWSLWREGRQPRVEDFLEQAGVRDPEEIVMALRVDQAERCRLGQWVPAEHYLDAFPAVRDDAASAIDLIFAEYLLREERGEQPPLEEFLRRFPEHAEELKLQIELHREIDDDPAQAAARSATWTTPDLEGGSARADGPGAYPSIPGFKILGVLGRGGMGIVYRAWQTELKRPVAIKMLIAGAMTSPEAAVRFRVEVEAMARLRHPNVVQIYGVGQHAGAPYLVLELVEGRSLAQALAGTPQAAEWAARTTEALARAIHAAHRLGVVHRDLSPANVLMADDGTPKVTDFGLAKLIIGGGSLRTQTGDLLGTPSYMSPEQAAGSHRSVGAAADIYALGAILYETLTGRPPFKAEEPLETLRQVVHEEPVTPSRLRPRLPRDIETICLKCLQKEPDKRYETARALADDLQRFLDGRPILARPISGAERAWRWCRRNRVLAAASAIAASAIITLAIGATVAALTFRAQRDQIRRADRETRESLFESLSVQAHSTRISGQVGQRFESLKAIERAARIARELKLPAERFDPLRDEAIACLALPDMEPTGRVIDRPPRVVLAAFDPSMSRYAFRFQDGSILVKNVDDDRELARFQAQGDREIFIFRFSPDGRYLATTHYPKHELTVWDIDRRSVAVSHRGLQSGLVAAFSPDSRAIAVGRADGELVIYSLVTGEPRQSGRVATSVQDLAFGPDGTQIAIIDRHAGSATCRILDLQSGRAKRLIELPVKGGVAWSPDGATLALSGEDNMIRLFDAASGISRSTLENSMSAGVHAAFHPTSSLLASNNWEGRLRIWDAALGRPAVSTPAGDAVDLRFGHDGQTVVWRENKLICYRVAPALAYRVLKHVSAERVVYGHVSIRNDGRLLAAATDRGVALWDLASGKELAFLPIGTTYYAIFEEAGDLLTLAKRSLGVHRWRVHVDESRGEFRIGPPLRIPLPWGYGIAASRSGEALALAFQNVALVKTAQRTIIVGPLYDCRSVALSPDGQWLATGNHIRGAHVWKALDGTRAAALPIDNGTRVVFSPEGKRLLTTGAPCRLWTVGTWREERQIAGSGLCFSPDGRLLLVQNANGVLELVGAESGRVLARLESPGTGVGWAVFSPDGARLVVSTNGDPAIHVWDLRGIRTALAPLGLDWHAPAYAERVPPSSALVPLPQLELDLGRLASHAQDFIEPIQVQIERHTAALAAGKNDAEIYHRRGHAYFQRGRSEEAAVDDFSRAIDLRPEDAHLRIVRAEINGWLLRRFEAAISDLEVALARDPTDVEVGETLAFFCNVRAAFEHPGPELPPDSERKLALARRCFELVPQRADYHMNLGKVEFEARQYTQAIATLERAMLLHPDWFEARNCFYLAMAYHRLGNRSKAREYFNRGVGYADEQHSRIDTSSPPIGALRAQAAAVLAGPPGELPADVFAPARPGE